MPVLMLLELADTPFETYERVNEIMGIHGDEDAPEGLIEHLVAEDDGNLIIADLWESAEAFGQFAETRLGPAVKEAGAGDAQPRVHEVHNQLSGKSDEANFLVLIEIEDFESDAYDEMTKQMDAHVNNEHPSVGHTAAHREGGGMVVLDVWDSPESFGAFAQEQIAPAAATVGLPPFEPRIVPIKNRIRGKSAASG
jgi:heme-degrading monooxygenase HmoA